LRLALAASLDDPLTRVHPQNAAGKFWTDIAFEIESELSLGDHSGAELAHKLEQSVGGAPQLIFLERFSTALNRAGIPTGSDF
jgi:hypothetical protein